MGGGARGNAFRFEPLLAQERHWDGEAFSHSKNESFMLY